MFPAWAGSSTGVRFQVSGGKTVTTKNYMDMDEGRKSSVGGQEAEIEACHGPKCVSMGLPMRKA